MSSEGVLDTRLLGKPKRFDGTTDNWRQLKFTFLGYAVVSRVKQAMIESEVLQDTAITSAGLPARDQRVSTQLCYMLILLLEGSAQCLLEHALARESRDRIVAAFVTELKQKGFVLRDDIVTSRNFEFLGIVLAGTGRRCWRLWSALTKVL